MPRGTVKWFNAEKGYGFLQADGLEKDVFVHIKQVESANLNGPLNEGDELSFDLSEGKKGYAATNLARL